MDLLRRIFYVALVGGAFATTAGILLKREQRPPPVRCDPESPKTCHRLALAYDRGDGGRPTDPRRARQLYEVACDHGLVASCSNLARLLLYGRGGPADPIRAGRLFARACEAGLATACMNLGVTYARLGDESKAARAYDLACRARQARACHYLAQRYERGRGVPQDPERAHALYVRACWLGYGPACGP